MKPKSTLRSFLAAATTALIAISYVHADTLYYDGGGTTTTGLGWGTNTNWSSDLAGTTDPAAAPLSTDDVIFSITGATAGVVGMNAARAVNSLTFSSSVANTLMAHTTTTTANSLTIGGGGVTINSGAGAVTFGVSTRGILTTTLDASQSWTHDGGNGFSVVQPVNLGANTLTLAGNGAGTASISGKISGTGGVIMNKTGGAVTLSGANDYSGGFTLSNGRVENVTGAYAGFGSGTLTINGGNMHFSGSSTIANNMIWNGSFQFSRPGTGTPIVTFSGDAELTGNFTTSQSATQPVSGVVFNGDISATGATKVLTLGTSGTTHTVNGGITGSVALTKTGSASLYMNAANNFSGLLTVSDGTVIMRSPSTIGGLSVASGKTFIYAPTSAGALDLGSESFTLASAVAANTALGGTLSQSAITTTGAASMSGTGVVNIRLVPGAAPAVGTHNLITAASGLTGGTYTLGTVYNNTDFTLSNFTRSATAISVDVASATALSDTVYWKGGLTGATGVWSASNGSTQSNWQVTDGVNQPLVPGATADLVFSTATSPGTMAGMTLGANMSVRTLTINNTATAFSLNNDSFNSTLTITPGSSSTGITLASGVQAASISAPLILGAAQTWTNNSGNAFTVNNSVNTNGNTLIIDGTSNVTFGNANSTITGSGGITKNGSGRLTLGANPSPSHSFSGDLVLNGGVTLVGGAATSNLGSGNLQLNGGVLEFYWTTTFDRALGSGAGQVRITGGVSGFSENGATGATIKMGNSTNTVVWGALGEGSATGFFNPSTLVLQASSAQAGSTLDFQNGIDLNGATRTIQVAKTTSVTSGATVSGVISNSNLTTAAGLTKTGPGILILSAANTFNGTTTVSGGVLSLTNSLALQNSALDTASSVAGSATTGLKTNKTTLTLGGLIGEKNFASTGGVFTDSGGYSAVTALTLNVATGNTHSYSGAIENGAVTTSLTKTGQGTQILSGTNSYTGATTVSAGTLTLGVDDCIANTSNVVIGAGTLRAADSVNDQVGTLDVTAAATINLGSGATLVFADSNLVDWTGGTLDITGAFVSGSSIKFTTSGGLSGGQLAAITINGALGSYTLDGSGYLQSGGGGGSYTTWASANGIAGELFDDDFDNDGISNGMEYALGLSPTASSQPPGVLSGNTITFTKGADAIANDDVSWIIETSETLATGSWSDAVVQANTNNDPTIAYTFTPGTPAKKFARLKVVKVP